MCAPNELMSTGTERSTDAAATSSNSMIVVSQSSAMPPPSSLTTPEMRPNSVSLRTIAPIFSRGTNWSRYSLLKIGSASAARKRRRLSTAAACSSVLITCPMSAPVSGGLLLGEDRDRDHGFLDAVEAAAVFLDGDARIAHLARARFTAQLRHELVDLAQAGGADRMAFRFEAARRVDRHAAADRQLAALGRRAAFAERHQQQRLDVEDLAHRRGVVHFGDVDVAEVHDASAMGEILNVESLLLVPFGEGGPAAERGELTIGGRMPVNPSGGLESKGHPIGATGLGQIHELVTQLRGEAGARQVRNARIAIQENGGGLYGIEEAVVAVSILAKQ